MSSSAYSNSGDQCSASKGHTSMQMLQYMHKREVDREPVEDIPATGAPAFGRWRQLLLVRVDVDAPVRALPGTEHADRAVLLGQRDHAPAARRQLRRGVGVLRGHRAPGQAPERRGQPMCEPETSHATHLGLFSAPIRPSTPGSPVILTQLLPSNGHTCRVTPHGWCRLADEVQQQHDHRYGEHYGSGQSGEEADRGARGGELPPAALPMRRTPLRRHRSVELGPHRCQPEQAGVVGRWLAYGVSAPTFCRHRLLPINPWSLQATLDRG